MRKRLAVMISVLVLAGGIAAPAHAEEELFDVKAAAEKTAKGTKLLHAKKYDAAIEALEEAVAAAPSAEAHYLLGYAYYIKGKAGDEDSRQKAIENFEMAYEIDPNFTPNKFLPAPPAAPQTGASTDVTPASIAPASKLDPAAAAPAPTAPKP